MCRIQIIFGHIILTVHLPSQGVRRSSVTCYPSSISNHFNILALRPQISEPKHSVAALACPLSCAVSFNPGQMHKFLVSRAAHLTTRFTLTYLGLYLSVMEHCIAVTHLCIFSRRRSQYGAPIRVNVHNVHSGRCENSL